MALASCVKKGKKPRIFGSSSAAWEAPWPHALIVVHSTPDRAVRVRALASLWKQPSFFAPGPKRHSCWARRRTGKALAENIAVVFLGVTLHCLYSRGASVHSGVLIGTVEFNIRGSPATLWTSIPSHPRGSRNTPSHYIMCYCNPGQVPALWATWLVRRRNLPYLTLSTTSEINKKKNKIYNLGTLPCLRCM